MGCCKNCIHHASQAEGCMCCNEFSPFLGLETENDDCCMEYCEDVSTWKSEDAL